MKKSESTRLDRITALGCIVCRLEGLGRTPAEVHHLVNGRKRKGHSETIPLCPLHHRGGNDNAQYTSRHPYKRRFEQRYGSEQYLLEETNRLLDEQI